MKAAKAAGSRVESLPCPVPEVRSRRPKTPQRMFAAALAVARIRALRIAQPQASLTRNVGGAPQGDALFCWPPSQAANDRATTTMLRLAALHLPSCDEGANEAGLARFRGEPKPNPRHRRAGTHSHVLGVFFCAKGQAPSALFFTRMGQAPSALVFYANGASPKRAVFESGCLKIESERSAHAGNGLDKTRTDALVPQPETGKISCVHHPRCGRLSPGACEG